MAPQLTLCLSYLQGRTGAPGLPGDVGDRGYIVRNSTKPRFGNFTFPAVTSENGKTLHVCLNLIKKKKVSCDGKRPAAEKIFFSGGLLMHQQGRRLSRWS